MAGENDAEEKARVTVDEAISSLVNQVAQLRADNERMHEQLRICHQTGAAPPRVDPSAASLVSPFSGKPGEDIVSFFDDLLAAAKVGLWSNDQLLQMTRLRLVGEAKTYVQCNEELRNALTFEAFKNGLLKRFQSQNSDRFFREQLSTVSMRQNESLENFVDRIRKINKNTYRLTGNEEANRIILQEAENRALDAFLRGLPLEMSRRVRAQFPKTLAQAVATATAFEEIDVATKTREKRGIFSTEIKCFRCDRRGHVARDCKQPECYNCGKMGHISKECRAKKQPECYNCGKGGHISKECRAKRQPECYNCGKVGHISKECRAKRAGAKNKQLN